MSLKAMNEDNDVLVVFWNFLGWNNISSFIDLLKYFNTLALILKLIHTFNQKSLFPKLRLPLRFFTHSFCLFSVSLGSITIFTKSPIVIFNTMAEDTCFQSFPKLILVFKLEVMSDFSREGS